MVAESTENDARRAVLHVVSCGRVLLRTIEQDVRQRTRLALAKAASVPVDLHARGSNA